MNKGQSYQRGALTLKGCLNFSVGLVALAVMLVLYSHFQLKRVEQKVEAFSETVVVGMPVAGLDEKAGKMGLKSRRTLGSSDQNGSLQVWEGFAFGRWFCDIDYRDGKTTNKRVTFLD